MSILGSIIGALMSTIPIVRTERETERELRDRIEELERELAAARRNYPVQGFGHYEVDQAEQALAMFEVQSRMHAAMNVNPYIHLQNCSPGRAGYLLPSLPVRYRRG